MSRYRNESNVDPFQGTSLGRVFLGGKDGCLYEFAYKADEGWFGKKAQKINHSNSTFSFLIPV
jgi:nuclear pore complex protein Nup155